MQGAFGPPDSLNYLVVYYFVGAIYQFPHTPGAAVS